MQPTNACTRDCALFTPKEKCYDRNSRDLSPQELIARPQLVGVPVVQIFRQSLQSLSVLREKTKSSDLSTCYVNG